MQVSAIYFVRALVDGMQRTIELRYSNVRQALNQACALISGGAVDVTIQDSRGNRIGGSNLAACCRGERILREDLRVE